MCQRVELKTFTEDIRSSLGVAEEKWVADSPVLIKNIVMGMTRDAKCRATAYNVDAAKITSLKAAAAQESGAQPFVSTNDILTAHYFKACDVGLGLMVVNMRGRIACATSNMSGNYEHTPVYDSESFASPNLIRARYVCASRRYGTIYFVPKLTTQSQYFVLLSFFLYLFHTYTLSLTSAAGKIRRVGGRAKLPQFCEKCPIAMITSWDFPFRVVFPNATQTLHLPTNPMKASEIPLDIACPFRPTPDTLAVLYYAKRATKASLTGGDDSPLGALLSSEIFQGWS